MSSIRPCVKCKTGHDWSFMDMSVIVNIRGIMGIGEAD